MDVRRGEGASSDFRVCKRSSEEKGKRVDGGARDQTLERFASTEKAGRCRARPVTRRPAGAAFAGRVNANMAIRRLPGDRLRRETQTAGRAPSHPQGSAPNPQNKRNPLPRVATGCLRFRGTSPAELSGHKFIAAISRDTPCAKLKAFGCASVLSPEHARGFRARPF